MGEFDRGPREDRGSRPRRDGPRRDFGGQRRDFGGQRHGGPRREGPREMFDAVCAECGQPCKVPFKPKEGRAVYCRECYANRS